MRHTPKSVAPLPGQDNRQIAATLGYARAEIDAMVCDGLLYAEEVVTRLATTQ